MSDPEFGDWPTAEDEGMFVSALKDYFAGGTPSDIFPSLPENTTAKWGWDNDTEDAGRVRWASFVQHFNLKNVGATDDPNTPYSSFAFKSIYFLPSCERHKLVGTTGGKNFGVLARIPVLVK
jgi:hypothetical protein